MSVSLAKGDKVKVSFEATAERSSGPSDAFATVISADGTYLYLNKTVMERVASPEPATGSLVQAAGGGKYVRNGVGKRAWFYLDECCERFGNPVGWSTIEPLVRILHSA